MPSDVGEAMVQYLQVRTSRHTKPNMFLRVNAPYGPLQATGVGAVVHDASVRVGMDRIGPHRLRHTMATDLLRAGGSLQEIAQVLRHQQLDTTVIYARVDRMALRPLARPWPGGEL